MGKLARVYDISAARDAEDMFDLSETNWDVNVVPATITLPDGTKVESGDYRAIVRPDTKVALSFVGNRSDYNSHRQQIAKLDGLIKSERLVPVTCSVWDNGAILAYQLRCPELDVTIMGKDVVSPLLTMVFGYGFKISDSAFFADFRWFCKNQLGRVAKLMTDRVRHYKGILDNYDSVLSERIKELGGELQSHYDVMRRMTQSELTGDRLLTYIGESVGLEKEATLSAMKLPRTDLKGVAGEIPEILDCYAVDDAGAPGTVWHAYNAVTRYETHHRVGTRGTSATAMRRMLLGDGQKAANEAYEAAARLVQLTG